MHGRSRRISFPSLFAILMLLLPAVQTSACVDSYAKVTSFANRLPAADRLLARLLELLSKFLNSLPEPLRLLAGALSVFLLECLTNPWQRQGLVVRLRRVEQMLEPRPTGETVRMR